ncbi:MAG: pyridoxamine 5'-phosphate oxidase family protein [Thermoanaerobacteraceae bacterium]|nr:pyridoxamine 5'-phosphate oxidase family protein [Thermoanaerobacteraceae bacterium]
MAEITAEMKAMIEKEQCFIVTADKTGQPSAAPKGSMQVLDGQTLAYGELVGKQTYRNLLENPQVAVVVTDRQALKGYRFMGRAELLSEGPLYDRFTGEFARMGLPRPKAAVKIMVEEIYDLSVRNPGEKIS